MSRTASVVPLLPLLLLLVTTALSVRTRYVRPPSYNDARVRVRVEQAYLCYPPPLMALLHATIAAVSTNATVPDERLALFSAHFDARVRALMPVCDAYATTARTFGRLWSGESRQPFQLDLIAPTIAAYVEYCHQFIDQMQQSLPQQSQPQASAALITRASLPHSHALVRCIQAKHFIEEAVGSYSLPTHQRQVID